VWNPALGGGPYAIIALTSRAMSYAPVS
jgi:hypothetical protein